MDRLLCDCVMIAVAVLLCVATQVRPDPAYLLSSVLNEMIMWGVCERECVICLGSAYC